MSLLSQRRLAEALTFHSLGPVASRLSTAFQQSLLPLSEVHPSWEHSPSRDLTNSNEPKRTLTECPSNAFHSSTICLNVQSVLELI